MLCDYGESTGFIEFEILLQVENLFDKFLYTHRDEENMNKTSFDCRTSVGHVSSRKYWK